MAFTKKSSAAPNRVHGEVPDLPDGSVELQGWWSEFRAVYDRVRDKSLEGETYTSLEKKKLDGVKDDVASIKTSIEPESIMAIYEANEDRNPFTNLLLEKLENIESHLGIVGVPVGTENEQVMANKVMDGGEF